MSGDRTKESTTLGKRVAVCLAIWLLIAATISIELAFLVAGVLFLVLAFSRLRSSERSH